MLPELAECVLDFFGKSLVGESHGFAADTAGVI